MPLSTLHPAPRGTQRKTRGQDGSLLLSCGALSSPTARRFIPTIALPCGRGSVVGLSMCPLCRAPVTIAASDLLLVHLIPCKLMKGVVLAGGTGSRLSPLTKI